MAKYMYKVSYSTDGLAGTVNEGFAEREKYLRQLGEGMGVTFEHVYWALGEDDAYMIMDGPTANVVGGSLAASMAGTGRVSTIPLFTAAEMDEARSKLPAYRKPGS